MPDAPGRPLERGSAVCFIGLGRMGLPMARRLAEAGYTVTGYDVGDQPRQELLAQAPGARAAPDAAAACRGADAVILMLPSSAVVGAVLEGQRILELLPGGSLLIDMGSSVPAETRRLAHEAARRNVRFVDAPVSGGVSGAQHGTLTIMAGGEKADVDRARPLLDVLGARMLHVGPSGAGHAVKALNNLLSATHLLATSEAMLVAREFGLDPAVVLDAINTSSGRSGSTENKWPKFVLTAAYDSGFGLQLMVKDMKIALGLARATGRPALLAEAAVGLWEEAAVHLPAAADHTEIVRWLEGDATRPEPLAGQGSEGSRRAPVTPL